MTGAGEPMIKVSREIGFVPEERPRIGDRGFDLFEWNQQGGRFLRFGLCHEVYPVASL
jgi:hypothetical protein